MRRAGIAVAVTTALCAVATPAAAHHAAAHAAQAPPPRIVVSSPANNAEVYDGSILVSGTASSPRPDTLVVKSAQNGALLMEVTVQPARTATIDGRWAFSTVIRAPEKGPFEVQIFTMRGGTADGFLRLNLVRQQAPPSANIFLTGFEATQVIQGVRWASDDTRRSTIRPNFDYPGTTDMSHIPLIAGKKTVVRLTAAIAGSAGRIVGPVYATLQAVRKGQPLSPSIIASNPVYLRPVGSTGTIAEDVKNLRNVDRNDSARTFNFVLPASWDDSDVDLTAIVNYPGKDGTLIRECAGCHDEANVGHFRVHFLPSGRIVVLPWQVRYVTTSPDTYLAAERLPGYLESIRQFMPIADSSFLMSPYRGMALLDHRDKTERDAAGVLKIPIDTVGDRTASSTTLSGVDTVEYVGHTAFVGVMPPEFEGLVTHAGVAETPGNDMVTMSGGDFYETPAHELGHNLGLEHAGCMHGGEEEGGGCDDTFPNDHACIGDVFGFDVRTYEMGGQGALSKPHIYGCAAGKFHYDDLMSYGNNRWPSNFTYLYALNYLRSHLDDRPANGLAVAAAAKAEPGPRTVIVGSTSPTGGKINALYQTVARPADELPRTGPYKAVVLDAGGAVLESRDFTPSLGEDPNGAFVLVLGHHDSAARVELRQGNTVLDFRKRSAHPPTVHWTDPAQPKPLEQTGERVVGWTSNDPDADPLTYVLQFSSDGGKTWRTIDSAIPDLSYPLDVSVLEGASQGRFRVLATDGFDTVADESDRVFPVPDKPPVASITSPEGGLTIAAGEAVSLEGTATDLEQGVLTAKRFEWRSTRDGLLGRGRSLTWFPSIGAHKVSLIVRDGAGNSDVAQVEVVVGRGTLDKRRPRVRSMRRHGTRTIVRFSEPVVGLATGTIKPHVRIAADPLRKRAVVFARRVRFSRQVTDLAGNRLRRR